MKAAKLLTEEPLAITETKLNTILTFLANGKIEGFQAAAKPGKFSAAKGAVAVLPVFGVLARRANMITEYSGGTSVEVLNAEFNILLNNTDVSTIVLLFDTPGGSVFGIEEFGASILNARNTKQIIGVVDPMAASAGYWLASQCESVVCTPSGVVGSIGVIMVHEDDSKRAENEGVTYTVVKSGKYKDEGVGKPLDEDAIAAMQSMSDEYYSKFVRAVAKGRGVSTSKVESEYGQGRVVTASNALAAGMVDRIATVETVLSELVAKRESKAQRDKQYRERKAALASFSN